MRDITAAAQPYVDAKHGTFAIVFVEVGWAAGKKYYGIENRSDPVAIEARLLDIPTIRQATELDRIGSTEQWSLELTNVSNDISAEVDAAGATLFETEVTVWMWFVADPSLSWPLDAVNLFHGVITGSKYEAEPNLWRFRVTSFEVQQRREIGIRVSRENFSELPCNLESQQIIPIVYGEEVRRVPAVLVDRPGDSILGQVLAFHEDQLTIYHSDAADQRFDVPPAEPDDIAIVVGWSGNYERLTGQFVAGTGVFNITTRSGWLSHGEANAFEGARGTIAGGTGGASKTAIWIPTGGGFNALSVATLTQSYIGHMLAIEVDGTWYYTMCTQWERKLGGAVVCYAGDIPVQRASTEYYAWRLSAIAGLIPQWNPGTPVNQAGPWKYIANAWPSEEVHRVEGTLVNNYQQQTKLGTQQVKQWVTFTGPADVADPADAFYEVDLDNRSDFNAAISRAVSGTDPGLTVITLKNPPEYYGLDPEVYVTLSGTTIDPDAASPAAASSPADILRHLLETVGELPADRADWPSFVAAQTALDAAGRDMRMQFALTETERLTTVAERIAQEATCRLSVIDGKFTLNMVPDFSDPANVATAFDDQNTGLAVTSDEFGFEDWIWKWHGTVKRFPDDKTPDRITSTAAESAPWRIEEDIEWQTYQQVSEAQKAQDFWHVWKCSRQRKVTANRFLDSLAIVPLDIVTLSLPLEESKAIVEKTETMSARRKCCGAAKLWSITASSLVSQDDCDLVPNDYRLNPPTGHNGTVSGSGGQTSDGWINPSIAGGCWCDFVEAAADPDEEAAFEVDTIAGITIEEFNFDGSPYAAPITVDVDLAICALEENFAIADGTYPVVGDRLIIRGRQVMYCYDLNGNDVRMYFFMAGAEKFRRNIFNIEVLQSVYDYPIGVIQKNGSDDMHIYDASDVRCGIGEYKLHYVERVYRLWAGPVNPDRYTVFPAELTFKVVAAS